MLAKDAKFLHVDNEDSNQTALLRSLIRVFVGRKRQKVRFLTFRPIFCIEKETEICAENENCFAHI